MVWELNCIAIFRWVLYILWINYIIKFVSNPSMFAIVITSVLCCETCCVDSSSTRCRQLALAALALELNHMCSHLQNKMKDRNHYRGVDVAIYIQEWWFAMEDMLLMRGDICLNQCWQCWHTWSAFSRRTFDCRCWWPTLQGTFWCLLWTNVVL